MKNILTFLAIGSALLLPGHAQEDKSAIEPATPAVKEEKNEVLPNSEVFIGMKDFNPRLTENLASKFKDAGPSQISQLLKNKKIIHSLNVWKITHICDRNTFAEIAQNKEGMIFLGLFARDSEWVENFLNSGPVGNPDATVAYLAEIFRTDPELHKNPVLKKLATATALEFGRKGWPEKDCVERYHFYKQSYEYKQLNPVFETLDYWDMRFVVGAGYRDWGSIENLTWLRDNVRLTVSGYCGAAYQVPYRLENYFGDSIHGSDYYRTFNDIYPTRAEMSREVGAVCGGLSSYGAYAAVANGVPALTMGEPGHCAYTVRVGDRWRACNTVFAYRRSTHWNFYGSEWSMLILTQEFMSDHDKLMLSGRYQRLGDLYAAGGNTVQARGAYVQGLKEQPNNIASWREYIDWEIAQNTLDAKAWSSINESVCKYFAADYPEICIQLLNNKIYPQLMARVTEFNRQLDELEKFHKLSKNMGPLQWDINKALSAQFKLLSSTDNKALSAMMKLLLSNHAKDSDFGGMILSWCQQQVEDKEDMKKTFFDDVAKMLARPGAVQADAIVGLADSTILAAEKNGDIASFQAIGVMMRRKFKDFSLPKYRSLPGELLSRGGLIKFTSIEDDPVNLWQHWGLLEKSGGHYKSGKDPVNPKATVMLNCIGQINGVVIFTEKTPKDATKDIKERTLLVEASEDGESWTKIDEIKDINDINIINCSRTPPRANQIRITRTGGGKGNWILNGVHIYGRRVS